MKTYTVRVRPSAARHLARIEARLTAEADETIARAYVSAILTRCFALDTFPETGTLRDDLQPGVRTISFRRKVVIAYAVEGEEVAILAIGWRGQEIATLLDAAGS